MKTLKMTLKELENGIFKNELEKQAVELWRYLKGNGRLEKCYHEDKKGHWFSLDEEEIILQIV